MHKCEECNCLSSEGEPGGDYHMTYCSKYDPAKDGYPRKKENGS